MIDFVRILFRDKSEFEPYVMNYENFSKVNTVMEYHSGEVHYPYKTRLGIMDVVLTKKYGYVKNSLHKLYNFRKYKEESNYNDFTYSRLIETINYISSIPNITQNSITQLEFGININVQEPAQEVIRRNVLMHNHSGYNHNRKFNGKGELKQFDHSSYVIKVYDKAKQFKLDYNVLRYEVKFVRRRDFNRAGIYNIDDLRCKNNLKSLFKIFLFRFDEMQIVDTLSEETIDPYDYLKLNRFTNPKYWEEDIRESSNQTKMRHRNQFKALIEKYGLDSTKKELRRLLVVKFNYLINN